MDTPISPRNIFSSCGALLVVLAALAAGGAAGGAALWYKFGRAGPGGQAEPPASLVYGRDDFTQLLMDKSEEDVVEAVGRPDRTSEDSDTSYWHYHRRTQDSVTNRLDDDAQVVFRGGKVVGVNY